MNIIQINCNAPRFARRSARRSVTVEARKMGSTAGSSDMYYYNEVGKKFRSRADVARFLKLSSAPVKKSRKTPSNSSKLVSNGGVIPDGSTTAIRWLGDAPEAGPLNSLTKLAKKNQKNVDETAAATTSTTTTTTTTTTTAIDTASNPNPNANPNPNPSHTDSKKKEDKPAVKREKSPPPPPRKRRFDDLPKELASYGISTPKAKYRWDLIERNEKIAG